MLATVVALLLAPERAAAGDPEKALYEHATALAERGGREFATIALEELARYDRRFPEGRFLDDVHLRMARLESERGRAVAGAARRLQVLIVDAGSLREAAAREELELALARERPLKPLAARFHEALARAAADAASPPRLRWVRALALVAEPESDELAIAEGERLIERDGGASWAPELSQLLGELWRRRSEPHRAIAAWHRVERLDPGHSLVPRALLLEGMLTSAAIGRHGDAIRVLERVAREFGDAPEAATAWLRKGEIERRELGRPEIALRDFDEVLRRYPEHPDAFAALLAKAETQGEGLRDWEGADQTLLEGVERQPEHALAPEALERAARIEERRLGAAPRAADNLERLAGRYPDFEGSPVALFHAAELREAAGERERAAQLFSEVARRWPENKLAERARKRARKLEPGP